MMKLKPKKKRIHVHIVKPILFFFFLHTKHKPLHNNPIWFSFSFTSVECFTSTTIYTTTKRQRKKKISSTTKINAYQNQFYRYLLENNKTKEKKWSGCKCAVHTTYASGHHSMKNKMRLTIYSETEEKKKTASFALILTDYSSKMNKIALLVTCLICPSKINNSYIFCFVILFLIIFL